MTPAGRSLGLLVERAVRRVRAEAVAATVLGVAAVVPALLLLAWLVGTAWPARSGVPIGVAGGAGLLALGLAVWLPRRWVRPVDAARVAAEAERRRGLPEGALRAILELGRDLPAGVSAALFRRSEAELAQRLADAEPRELGGALGERVRGLRVRLLGVTGVLAALTATLGLAAPERARAGWVPLLHPLAHLSGPALPPLSVRPGDADVPRGGTVAVDVDAPQRDRVVLHWSATGDVPHARSLPVSAGGAAATLGPVNGDVRYWVAAADGAVTDTFTLRPVDPLLLRSLVVELEYPGHVGRAAERFQGEVPTLEVPEGTRLRLRGSATRPLHAAGLTRADGEEKALAVDGPGFELDWTLGPGATGRWSWRLAGARGERSVDAAPLQLRVVRDSAPRVRITSPGPDAPMPPSQRQRLLAVAEDDHGVTSAAVVFRRVGARGPGSETRAPVPVADASPRLELSGLLDATGASLVPGDLLEYHLEVTDNSPRRQVGRSATHVLRVPGSGALRERASAEVEAARDAAERLVERSREVEQETRSATRRAGSGRGAGAAGASPGPPSSERLAFESARRADDALSAHEALLGDASSLADRLEALERSLAEAGLHDPDLQRRLSELQEALRGMAGRETAAEVEATREAVEALDPEAVERALEQLAARQEALRDAVEQSLDLMRRAAAEQALGALEREAQEVASAQRALAEALAEDANPPRTERGERGRQPGGRSDQPEGRESGPPGGRTSRADSASPPGGSAEPENAVAGGDSTAAPGSVPDSAGTGARGLPQPSLPIPRPELPTPDRASQQDSLAERARRLNASLQALRPQLLQIGERESASEAGAAQESGEAAQRSMEQASSQAKQQEGGKAAASGRQAAGEMSDVAGRLGEARRQMTDSRRQEAQRSVRQATQEALDLAEREEALRASLEAMAREDGAAPADLQAVRSEQAALQQGLEQLGRNLAESRRRTGMVQPDVAQAVAGALLDMEQTMTGLGDGGLALPVEQAERTVDSLNRLAMSLLENEAQIEHAENGASEQAARELAELAQQQAGVNAQSGALVPLELSEQTLSRQLPSIARRQRSIGRRVGEIGQMAGGREDVLGQLDALASEAGALARELEGGRLDPEVRARQERLFHRLLDAGRSLERDEYSDEREGTTAGSVAAESPEALDLTLLDDRPRYAPPHPDQLRHLSPAYRRLILQYFERLNGRTPAADEGGG